MGCGNSGIAKNAQNATEKTRKTTTLNRHSTGKVKVNSVFEDYRFHQVLGSGAFAEVRK
jgi:hypothetical protein